MESVAHIVELTATFIENAVIICTVTEAGGRKFLPKKHFLLTLLFTAIISTYVTLMNSMSTFSFLTPLGTMLSVIFIVSRILSKGNFLLCSTACIMVLFVIQTFDYLFILGAGLLDGNPKETMFFLLEPCWQRFVYILSDKAFDVLLFLLLRRHTGRLQTLRKKHMVLLFIACGLSYMTMQYLFSMTIYGDYAALQGASIISFTYLLCFLIAVVIALFSITEVENERISNELLRSSNQMLEQNYQQMHKNTQDNAKRLHDFHHHLVAIRGMAGKGQTERIGEYVSSLLETSYQELKLCRSGCDIVDAIINYQHMQAQEKGIDFKYRVKFGDLDAFAPVDICAILSNQIENAIEACDKIGEKEKRFVSIEIRQQEDFVLFQVANSVQEDPFVHNSQLATTKSEGTFPHGLGLKNIRDAAKKYSGSLQTRCENGVFTSTVLLLRQFTT